MSDTNVEVETELEPKTIVSLDDEVQEEQNDSSVIKDLRKRFKDANREISELKKSQVKPEVKDVQLGARPKLEDFEYDEDAYAQNLDNWLMKKSHLDAKEDERKQQADEEANAWNKKLSDYSTARESFGPDFEEAEEAVKSALTENQQGALIHVLGSNCADFVAALGISPKRLKKLSQIKDNMLFMAEVGRLDAKMKDVPGKVKTVPETRVTGGGGKEFSGDSALDALRAKAAKTGDYTDVIAHKRKMRNAE